LRLYWLRLGRWPGRLCASPGGSRRIRVSRRLSGLPICTRPCLVRWATWASQQPICTVGRGGHRRRWRGDRSAGLGCGRPFFSHGAAHLRQAGWWVDSYFCFGNWYLEVAGRSLCRVFRRSRLKDAPIRLPGHAGVWQRCRNFGWKSLKNLARRWEAAITDYQTVYARSWKNPKPFPAFIPELCRLAANRGWLRLGLVRLCATSGRRPTLVVRRTNRVHR